MAGRNSAASNALGFLAQLSAMKAGKDPDSVPMPTVSEDDAPRRRSTMRKSIASLAKYQGTAIDAVYKEETTVIEEMKLLSQSMSNPENDKMKRKAALKAAKEKLALRKKQREELRAARAARLGGTYDASPHSKSSSIAKLNKQSSNKKQQPTIMSLMEVEDEKESPFSSAAPNKASLLREPRKYESRIYIFCCARMHCFTVYIMQKINIIRCKIEKF